MKTLRRSPLIGAAFACAVLVPAPGGDGNPAVAAAAAPTSRELWMAPSPEVAASRRALARAVADAQSGRHETALPALTAAAADPLLGSYARLHAARILLIQSRPSEASDVIREILVGGASDALSELALRLDVEAAGAVRDQRRALAALSTLTSRRHSNPASVLFDLVQAAIAVGDRATATRAFGTLYFDHAGTPESSDAIDEMQRIGIGPPAPTRETSATHLARAERLYSLGRYTDARAAFLALQRVTSGADRELTTLRTAQCDLFLKKHATAATALRAYADKATSRSAEAEYHYLTAIRALGRVSDYVGLVRRLVDDGRDPVWAERALNELGTYYILADEDEKAAAVFAEQYAKFPQGSFADRAAWRSGWWAYKEGRFADAVRVFESAATTMRRADYRPAWLYWAARAHRQLGHRDQALEGFRRTIADYRNSYYGRAAVRDAEQIQAALRPAGAGPVSPARIVWPTSILPSPRPENANLIEHLLAAGMFDEAIAELRALQAAGQGSPLIEATISYALNRQGKLRPAITAMRRAYPQFMAEGGEALPLEILTVIFPIDYWDLLREHAAARKIDPYLLAALVAQESTFQADVRSSANAWGLMQIIPATGKRLAASLGIRPFSTYRLVEPEVNVRIGTTYFASLLNRFGDAAPALAAYNAGENRASRWLAERPGFDREEFIDDIPFPETQNYVKRILGTAEDYRNLYGK